MVRKLKIKTGEANTLVEKDRGILTIQEGEKKTIVEISYNDGMSIKTTVEGKTGERYYSFVCRRVFDKLLAELNSVKDDKSLTAFLTDLSQLSMLFNAIQTYLDACR